MPLDISTVSYLPEPVKTKVKNYQKLISKKFNTIRALDWIPHITIADRVIIPENRFNDICKKLEDACSKTAPIKIKTMKLHLFEITNPPFENPCVIFIELEVSKELQRLHDTIQNNIYKWLKRPSYKAEKYSPHITLAYRDLTKKNFIKAKQFLKHNKIIVEYQTFVMDNIQLVVPLLNEKRRSIKKFEFKNRQTF